MLNSDDDIHDEDDDIWESSDVTQVDPCDVQRSELAVVTESTAKDDTCFAVCHAPSADSRAVTKTKRKRRSLPPGSQEPGRLARARALHRLTEWVVCVSSHSWDSLLLAHVTALLEDERPQFFVNHISGHHLLGCDSERHTVHAVLKWFRGTFSVPSAAAAPGGEGVGPGAAETLEPAALARLLAAPAPRVVSPLQLCLLMHSCLLVLGLRVRLVYSLDPQHAHPCETHAEKKARLDGEQEEDQEEWWATTPLAAEAWLEVQLVPLCRKEAAGATAAVSSGGPCSHFNSSELEAATDTATWVNVHPLHNIVDDKTLLEKKCRSRRSSVSYVVAITSPAVLQDSNALTVFEPARGCGVQDVTFSYACNPSLTRRKRLTRAEDVKRWRDFQESFLPPRRPAAAAGGSSSSTGHGGDSYLEDDGAGADSAPDILPTSKSAFLNHPRYVLKAHLRDHQVLSAEAKPLGVLSGISIYRRQDVFELRTKWEWRKLRREVRLGEVPVRVRGARRSSQRQQDSAAASVLSSSRVDTEVAEGMYAEWQTDARATPQLVNGAIPRNEYGNIAIWGGDLSLVPEGAVYIRRSSATAAARELGIPHVEALVGFRQRGTCGQLQPTQVPVLEGVVVLEEFADLIEESSLAMEARAAQLQKEDCWKRISKKWQQLVDSLTLRERLRQSYGA